MTHATAALLGMFAAVLIDAAILAIVFAWLFRLVRARHGREGAIYLSLAAGAVVAVFMVALTDYNTFGRVSETTLLGIAVVRMVVVPPVFYLSCLGLLRLFVGKDWLAKVPDPKPRAGIDWAKIEAEKRKGGS